MSGPFDILYKITTRVESNFSSGIIGSKVNGLILLFVFGGFVGLLVAFVQLIAPGTVVAAWLWSASPFIVMGLAIIFCAYAFCRMFLEETTAGSEESAREKGFLDG